MSTHNICFHEEIRKIFIWIPLLYGAKIGTSTALALDRAMLLCLQPVQGGLGCFCLARLQ